MVKREKITGRELCRMAFETTKKWITAQELCDIAKEKGFFKLYDSNAINETAAIKALLYVEAQKEDGEFIGNDSFPVEFQLRKKYIKNDRKKDNKLRSKFLQLAVKVLEEEDHPLTASDIFDIAVDEGYYKNLKSKGKTPKTPRATLSSMLSTNSTKVDGIFTASDSRPKQYSLRSRGRVRAISEKQVFQVGDERGVQIIHKGIVEAKKYKNLNYEIALSFAGEQRDYVENIAKILHSKNIKVFYDNFEEEKAYLWGKELTEAFEEIYGNARYCIMFISKEYAVKMWTNEERRNAISKAIKEKNEYILPVRFDDTKIPGIRDTIGYIDLSKTTPEDFSRIIFWKLGVPIK
jgi:hypothetical protein